MSKGTRRSSLITKRARTGERVIEFARAFGLKIGILVFVLWLGSWLWLSGGFARTGEWAEAKLVSAAGEMGFRLDNLLVEGRVYTDPDTLKAIINIQKGDPLFSFDPSEAAKMLEKIAWVKAAHVERRLPDTIFIRLDERKPLALWQRNQRVSVIGSDGVVLTDDRRQDFKDLIILIGDEAPQKAESFIKTLEAEPEIEKRVEAATCISGRRWDLILKDGKQINLPEEDMGLALRRLAQAQEEGGILDKTLLSIDMREPDRIGVRVTPGAAQDYKANFSADGAI